MVSTYLATYLLGDFEWINLASRLLLLLGPPTINITADTAGLSVVGIYRRGLLGLGTEEVARKGEARMIIDQGG